MAPPLMVRSKEILRNVILPLPQNGVSHVWPC